MKYFNYPHEQDALQAFSTYLLNNKLDELSAHQLSIAFDYDIPLLEKVKDLDREQLHAITKQGFTELLTYLSEGNVEKQINDTLQKWNKDELQIVSKFDINVKDITYINEVRERTLNAFINDFTHDPALQEKISIQIHQFILASSTAGFEGYVSILKQQIAKQEKQLLEAQALAKVGSFEWDLARDVSEHTPQLAVLFGRLKNGYKNWMENVHPEDKSRVENAVKESFVTGNYNAEYRYIVNDSERLFWSKGEVLFDANNKPVLMRGTVQDVTEWKKILLDLEETTNEKTQLKLLNQYKDEFLNIASHELKSPLTSIKAFLQLTAKAEVQPQVLQFITRSLSHVKRLEKLIADLLDTSKLNAGQLIYNKEYFDINALTEETISQLRYNHSDREIIFRTGPTATVFADKLRIEQVINNLTENALKYSEEPVLVSVDIEGSNVCIHVQDKGIGISEKDQEQLFNRFYRSPGVTYSHQGLGLGLYISAKIMEHHNGEIAVKSEVDKGSCFTICLPHHVTLERSSAKTHENVND
jgi:signal transduction histidine kinase